MNKKKLIIAGLVGLVIGLYAHKIPVVASLAAKLPGRSTPTAA